MNKESFKLSAKLYGHTVFVSVLSVIMYVSVTMLTLVFADDEGIVPAGAKLAGNILSLVLQGVLFISFTYNDLWRQGDRDANAVSFGRMAYDKWRGLKIGLTAAIPSILSFAVLIAEKALGFFPRYAAWYRVFHLSFYPFIVWCFGSEVARTTAEIGWGGILLAGIPVLVMPAVAVLAYYLGYKQIAVGERLIYKNKNTSKKR